MIKKMKNSKLFIHFTILSSTIVLIYYVFLAIRNNDKLAIYQKEFHELIDKEFRSTLNCKCRSETIDITNRENNIEIYSKIGKETNLLYSLNKDSASDLYHSQCDLFNVLRRGPNQKVIGYSLYGSNPLYYKYLKKISELTAQFFPEWTIRIYYDDAVNTSIICETECLKDAQGVYFDNVDFCKVSQIPYGVSNTWIANYMHAMTWRWIPLGDKFVDYFMSRDTDSCPNQRELDSVNDWLSSNTLFHVMRDHPRHGTKILGGLWGFANVKNRDLASHLYQKITREFIAKQYNKKQKNPKGFDKFLLSDIFWKYARKNGTVHDSYTCKVYGGKPFPTQRPKNFTFLGDPNCSIKGTGSYVCPIECRPVDHQDWIYC